MTDNNVYVAVPGSRFVACFDCITMFKALWRGAYVKGGACMHWVNSFHIYTACMSPALSENSALEHYKRGNTMEIHELNNV